MREFLEELDRGDEIFWNDPDGCFSSGYYFVQKILSESGKVESEDTIILCSNGYTDIEVFAHEIE